MKHLFRKTILKICSKVQDYYGGEFVTLWFAGEKVHPFIHSTRTRVKRNSIILINWDTKKIEVGKWGTNEFVEKTK
jgi:hypothetical protein